MENKSDKGQMGRPINEKAREERMAQILNGARACFVQKGFHGASISHISAAAGVSTANIYQYFPNKDALIFAMIESDLTRKQEMIYKLAETDYRAANIIEAFYDFFTTDDGHDYAVLRAEIASEGSRNNEVAALLLKVETALTEVFVSAVTEGQQNGRIPQKRKADEIAECIALIFEGTMRLYVFSKQHGRKLLESFGQHVENIVYSSR